MNAWKQGDGAFVVSTLDLGIRDLRVPVQNRQQGFLGPCFFFKGPLSVPHLV